VYRLLRRVDAVYETSPPITRTAEFRQRLAGLRVTHARKPSLLERLELAGLDD